MVAEREVRSGELQGEFDRSTVDAFAVLWDYLVIEPEPEPADAAFCFGSRDRSVPRVGADLYHRGLAPLVLVTGGVRLEGAARESEVFALDLIASGVPRDRILVERHATNTGENVSLGFEQLRAHGRPSSVLAVCCPIVTRRCVATFARQLPALRVLPVPALPAPRHRWKPTTAGVLGALGEWERLRTYSELGYTSPQPRPSDVDDAARLLACAVGEAVSVAA